MTMLTETPRASDIRLADDLRFDHVVPRALVHRAAICEVFVSDSERLSDDRYLVAGQLPRTHSFYNDCLLPYYDLLLTLETARQGAVLVAHRYLGVPLGYAFIFQSVDLRITDLDAHRIGPEPGRLVVEVEIVDRQERDGVLAVMGLRMGLAIDGRSCSEATGAGVFLPREAYQGLRAHVRSRKALEQAPAPAPRRPLPPTAVGRLNPRNVVVAEARLGPTPPGVSTDVLVDRTHPCLFDHPLDHVPGMLLLEAYRQSAILATTGAAGSPAERAVLTRCQAVFTEFAELELPTLSTVSTGTAIERLPEGPAVPAEVVLSQATGPVSTGTAEVTLCR